MDSFKILLTLLFCIGSTYGKLLYNTVKNSIHRSTTYSPKLADKTCLLKPDPGPCRAALNMYYFDPLDMNCSSTFQWGGCMGNGNRFDTFSECIDSCLTQPGRKTRPHYCSLRFDYGFCFGDTKRWYYDELWHVCKETIYSGCGGNKNNFYNQEQFGPQKRKHRKDKGASTSSECAENALHAYRYCNCSVCLLKCDSICRFGNGPASETLSTDHIKKVIIINPLDSTPHRGKDQNVELSRRTTQSENPSALAGDALTTEKPVVSLIPG